MLLILSSVNAELSSTTVQRCHIQRVSLAYMFFFSVVWLFSMQSLATIENSGFILTNPSPKAALLTEACSVKLRQLTLVEEPRLVTF